MESPKSSEADAVDLRGIGLGRQLIGGWARLHRWNGNLGCCLNFVAQLIHALGGDDDPNANRAPHTCFGFERGNRCPRALLYDIRAVRSDHNRVGKLSRTIKIGHPTGFASQA